MNDAFKRLDGNLRWNALAIGIGGFVGAYCGWAGFYMIGQALEKHSLFVWAITQGGMYSTVGVGGFGFVAWSIRTRLLMISEYQEKAILRFVQTQGNRPLSRLEIAAQSDLTLKVTEKKLRELEAAGACQTHVDDKGELTYVFGNQTERQHLLTDERAKSD